MCTFKYYSCLLKKMNILVTGGSGLLGSAISFYLKDYFKVTATYTAHPFKLNGCDTIFMDITDEKSTAAEIKKIKPDAIIHTAALVGVDVCEKDPTLAHRLHVEGTRNVVNAAKHAKIIYISTDYVFDGRKGMYKETDEPHPINYYGRTKLEGESIVNSEKNAIIRTSLFGWSIVKDKKNFATWILNEMADNRRVNMFADQYKSIILVNDLAIVLKEIVERNITGILNVAYEDRFNKYDFAMKLADVFGLDKRLIQKVRRADVPGHEKMPLDVSLDISKAKKLLRTKIPSLHQGFVRLKKLRDESYLDNFKLG